MKSSKRAVQFIKDHEGLRLSAYHDAVGILTIGYGHTSDDRYAVHQGDKITKAQADKILEWDITEAEDVIDRVVRVPLNPNEYGALVSLVFNIGPGAFQKSTLLRRLNQGKRDLTNEFGMWVKGTKNGRKVTLPGLVRRRAEEAALFATPTVLADKVVNQPPILGSSQATKEARGAKRVVVEDRSGEPPVKTLLGGALAALVAPILQFYSQLKDAFGDLGQPVSIFLGVAAAVAIVYVVWRQVRSRRGEL